MSVWSNPLKWDMRDCLAILCGALLFAAVFALWQLGRLGSLNPGNWTSMQWTVVLVNVGGFALVGYQQSRILARGDDTSEELDLLREEVGSLRVEIASWYEDAPEAPEAQEGTFQGRDDPTTEIPVITDAHVTTGEVIEVQDEDKHRAPETGPLPTIDALPVSRPPVPPPPVPVPVRIPAGATVYDPDETADTVVERQIGKHVFTFRKAQ